MKVLLRLTIVVALVLSVLNAWEETTSCVDEMFSNGTLSGEYRAMFAGYRQELPDVNGTQAAAVGGFLKYELSELNGFSAAVAYRLSYDVNVSSYVEGFGQNDELSSARGKYGTINEAYVNYNYGGFNLRAGRQIIDTPLADSDDIRMIDNTFEAYIASYEGDNLSFMLGKLEKWQGVDAGLLDQWDSTGTDGTLFGGITINTDIVEFSAWYYNITEVTNASYFDISFKKDITEDIYLLWAIQSLNEIELNNSGYEASIYGTIIEFSAYGIGFSAAYNKSDKKTGKASFSGFGGGTLFTSMDTMILDEIAVDRDASALLGGITIEAGDLTLSYAYGDFIGSADGLGTKAHIVERNYGVEFGIIKDELNIVIAYTIEEDVESAVINENDWERGQVMISYNF